MKYDHGQVKGIGQAGVGVRGSVLMDVALQPDRETECKAQVVRDSAWVNIWINNFGL